MALFPQLEYDVVICGGGFAGSTLARQLKLEYPDVRILVLEKKQFPLPLAAVKVGESTVEVAAFYLAETLQLRQYMDNKHLFKLGFRLFFGDGRLPLEQRPELGLATFSPFNSYQIDRGLLENDLRRMNLEAGIEFRDGVSVKDVEIGEPHKVTYKDADGVREVSCRWVVDAMGRRRFLQKKLGLKKDIENTYNSVWFRVKGKLDLTDWVPEENRAWHDRVPERIRYSSTNHLMGQGYWIWIIPLSTNHTSVGLVAQDSSHPFPAYHKYDRLMEWLAQHEPALHRALGNMEPVDFLKLKKFSYSSKQIFSRDRWACPGEAGVFPDPLYSPGSNLIGFSNSIITQMVGQDVEGTLCERAIEGHNHFIISQNEWLMHTIHPAYDFHSLADIMFLNFLWAILVGWTTVTPQMFNHIYLDSEKDKAVRETLTGFFPLAIKVKEVFDQWKTRHVGRKTFQYINYLKIPFVAEVYHRNLTTGKSVEELVRDHRFNMEILIELAQTIYILAKADISPQEVIQRPINPYLMDLENQMDLTKGTPPQTNHGVYEQISALFQSVEIKQPV